MLNKSQDKDTPKQPTIFDFSSYRVFLKAMYKYYKQSRRGFTYTRFAQELGYLSASPLKLIVHGHRNMTFKSVPKVLEGLKLSTNEQGYFEALHGFEHSRSMDEKQYYCSQLSKFAPKKGFSPLDSDTYKLLCQWHYTAIYELMRTAEFKSDPEWISKQFFLPLTVEQVQEALSFLQTSGLIEKRSEGFVPVDMQLTSTDEKISKAVRDYHTQSIANAQKMLPHLPVENREYRGATVAVDKQTAQLLKKRIQEFERDLVDLCGRSMDPDHVYQFNIQFYPLTSQKGSKDVMRTK